MSFFQINILILGFYGVISYLFLREKRKIKLYESLFSVIYFPIFVYFYIENQEGELKLHVVQTWVFVLFLFESIVIFNIYKLIKNK